MNRKNLTPKAKKLLSYLKDTRNTYGESRSRSRFAIAKRKTYGHQAFRHEQKMIIKEVLKVTGEEIETIEAKMNSVEPKKWRKYADSPLGEFVSILLKNREIRGINKDLKSSSILKTAELKTRRKNQWHYRRWHKSW